MKHLTYTLLLFLFACGNAGVEGAALGADESSVESPTPEDDDSSSDDSSSSDSSSDAEDFEVIQVKVSPKGTFAQLPDTFSQKVVDSATGNEYEIVFTKTGNTKAKVEVSEVPN